MKSQLFQLILLFLFSLSSFEAVLPDGGPAGRVYDGPYIFKLNSKLKVRWISDNIMKSENLSPEKYSAFKTKFHLLCNYKDLTDSYLLKSDYSQSYDGVDSISVISDIHGAYNTYINLLKASGIIDENLNWKYGKGHLVVLGDIFDRGDKVTEVLWHLFGLEKQASEAGGMVHVMLGNHELLVLSKDLRYMNEKYVKVEGITKETYSDLYSENSVLGNWLRSKPIVVTINNILFVHGGLSIEMVRKNINISQINKTFKEKIVGKDNEEVCADPELLFLSDTYGPLWYRGYFNDKSFSETRLDSILSYYKTKSIVVGHTTLKEIRSLYNTKIFAVDAGIMNDEPGEMLIYKNGLFYKGYITGIRVKL